MDNANLTFFEKDQLLSYFRQYMSQETRGDIMRQLPAAYNSWCGREVARVHAIDDKNNFTRPKLRPTETPPV